MNRTTLAALALALLVPAWAAHAQDTAAARGIVDSAAPRLVVDGGRLRPRGALYDVLVTSDSGTQHVGWHTVWVYEASFSNRAAWEVLERRESHAPYVARITRDSAIVSRDSLHPLRWEATAGDARLVAAFANDSVYGGTSAPVARASFTVAAPVQVITSEGTLDALLQAAPLAEGWQATADMLLPDMSGARLVPVRLTVLRSESVDVPAGRFDAWVVEVTIPGAIRAFWVDRGTQLVVRTVETPAHMPAMQVERVLVGGY